MQRDFWLSSGSAHVWNIGQKTPATDVGAPDRRADDAAGGRGRSRRAHALFREVQRIFSEQLPVLYFAAPRLYLAVSRARPQRDAGDHRPQLLWSADTLAVAPPAATR